MFSNRYLQACLKLIGYATLFVVIGGPTGGGGTGGGGITPPAGDIGGTTGSPTVIGVNGNAKQFVVNNLGTTNTPACNFNSGYVCLWTQTSASTLTVSNIPGTTSAPVLVTLEVSAPNNGSALAVTLPASFAVSSGAVSGNYAGSQQLYTAEKSGGGNALNTFVFYCDGTVCWGGPPGAGVQTGAVNINTLSTNSAAVVGGAATALQITAGGILSITGGTAPTLTAGCNGAGSSVNAASTDNRGLFTSQTAAATTCTLTFNHTWPQAPICICGDANASTTPVGCSVGAVGTGTAVFDFASTAARTWTYHCE
jgi:hypothetical protein